MAMPFGGALSLIASAQEIIRCDPNGITAFKRFGGIIGSSSNVSIQFASRADTGFYSVSNSAVRFVMEAEEMLAFNHTTGVSGGSVVFNSGQLDYDFTIHSDSERLVHFDAADNLIYERGNRQVDAYGGQCEHVFRRASGSPGSEGNMATPNNIVSIRADGYRTGDYDTSAEIRMIGQQDSGGTDINGRIDFLCQGNTIGGSQSLDRILSLRGDTILPGAVFNPDNQTSYALRVRDTDGVEIVRVASRTGGTGQCFFRDGTDSFPSIAFLNANTYGIRYSGSAVRFIAGASEIFRYTTTAVSFLATSMGFFSASAVAQQSGTGETTGFTAGAGTGVNDDSTFTGNVGTRAYRISDIVKALKNYGLLAAS